VTTNELSAIAGSTEAAVVAGLAIDSVAPRVVEPGVAYAVPTSMGGVAVIDTDAYAPSPRRATAHRHVSDAESFVTYLNRHKLPGTEVFAHVLSSSVIGIIDSHEGTAADPGWQGHKVSLALEHSKEWIAWNDRDLGQNPKGWFDQQEFAEFIEDRALDVIEPDHASLIELALKFEATSRSEFKSHQRLDDGSVQFDYTDTVTAKAGPKGDITIPKQLRLALRPYIGGPRVYVYAQFRFRVNGGALKLGFALERPENILETAFSDIVTEIREGKTLRFEDKPDQVVHGGIGDVPIYYGKP